MTKKKSTPKKRKKRDRFGYVVMGPPGPAGPIGPAGPRSDPDEFLGQLAAYFTALSAIMKAARNYRCGVKANFPTALSSSNFRDEIFDAIEGLESVILRNQRKQ